jgi:hypothetical protein
MLVGWELIDTKCLGWAGPRASQWECEVEMWAMWAVGSLCRRWTLWTAGGRLAHDRGVGLKVPREYLFLLGSGALPVAVLRRGFPGRRGVEQEKLTSSLLNLV